jgi:hypothetical protein
MADIAVSAGGCASNGAMADGDNSTLDSTAEAAAAAAAAGQQVWVQLEVALQACLKPPA